MERKYIFNKYYVPIEFLNNMMKNVGRYSIVYSIIDCMHVHTYVYQVFSL